MHRKENDIQTGSLMAGIFATIAVATGAFATALALVAIASFLSSAASMKGPLHHFLSATVIALTTMLTIWVQD